MSKISERTLLEVTEWQIKLLEAFYPFIFIDEFHCIIKENHQVVTKASHAVLGINDVGMNEVLGLWVSVGESEKYWIGLLGKLNSR